MLKIVIKIKEQRLYVYDDNRQIGLYSVSSSRYGIGEHIGSHKTPKGWHEVYAKIGEGASINTVFIGRRPTKEIYTNELSIKHPNRDWVLTRILQLNGLEAGINLFGDVDTLRIGAFIFMVRQIMFHMANRHLMDVFLCKTMILLNYSILLIYTQKFLFLNRKP